PNPFNDAVRIGFKVEKAGEVRLELFDIQGRKILSEAESFPSGSGDYVIDGDRLGGAGVYLLRIGMNGGWRTLKLIYMP
ncbi:MAG TPA: T9SS type A sorting domain-containing protein, partial [Bacteroidetes bacterium]|nr:T9SS type A sorting domain-containing protein [Bacteroidota bacterium]